MTTTRELPTDSLAELIRAAIADAETLDRAKYRPTAAIWHAPEHAPQRHLPKGPRCRVCLAGAVIAGRLDGDIKREISPGNYTVETYDALYALDCARKGDWPEAYRRL
ncbi:MAG: hypothetical protein OXC14_18405, partial [Rhodospirillaceae bacterium]|nr:hypothetical protein [Rhodospirillaceae bacterium]